MLPKQTNKFIEKSGTVLWSCKSFLIVWLRRKQLDSLTFAPLFIYPLPYSLWKLFRTFKREKENKRQKVISFWSWFRLCRPPESVSRTPGDLQIQLIWNGVRACETEPRWRSARRYLFQALKFQVSYQSRLS